ncbi:hypothetical protein PV328_007642 [Microctonus aethiopoides]|uniref:Uncharacterized protein n=1 Tax=Microctonus aethiopoides TaxID=144406 RepID=A0AA39EZQ4_9HYME|nr:hypothetical protein PV328_007642 [Microctonus aethiopoides]
MVGLTFSKKIHQPNNVDITKKQLSLVWTENYLHEKDFSIVPTSYVFIKTCNDSKYRKVNNHDKAKRIKIVKRRTSSPSKPGTSNDKVVASGLSNPTNKLKPNKKNCMKKQPGEEPENNEPACSNAEWPELCQNLHKQLEKQKDLILHLQNQLQQQQQQQQQQLLPQPKQQQQQLLLLPQPQQQQQQLLLLPQPQQQQQQLLPQPRPQQQQQQQLLPQPRPQQQQRQQQLPQQQQQ